VRLVKMVTGNVWNTLLPVYPTMLFPKSPAGRILITGARNVSHRAPLYNLGRIASSSEDWYNQPWAKPLRGGLNAFLNRIRMLSPLAKTGWVIVKWARFGCGDGSRRKEVHTMKHYRKTRDVTPETAFSVRHIFVYPLQG